MDEVSLSPTPSRHDGKWIAPALDHGTVVAAARTLRALISHVGEENVIFQRVFPRDVSVVFRSV
jgi:hypothetical protein